MTSATTRKGTAQRAAPARRSNKTDYIMVRISPENKAEVEGAALRDDEAVASWCRTRLLKLARGWRLMPPGA